MSNGETKADLLTHVRYPLMKSPDDWTDFQREEMHLLFEVEPKMKVAYGLLCALRNIFSKIKDRRKARKALQKLEEEKDDTKKDTLLLGRRKSQTTTCQKMHPELEKILP